METVDRMKRFNELLKEEKFIEACDFLATIPEESLTSFPRPSKIKAIEVLSNPAPDCIKTALLNQEWFNANSTKINKCLIVAVEEYKEKNGEPVKEKDEEPKEKKPKKGKKRKRRIKLSDLDSPAEVPIAPAKDEESKVVEREAAPDEKEEAVESTFCEAPDVSEDITEINDKLAMLQEAVAGLLDNNNKLNSRVSRLGDSVINSHNNINEKIEALHYAFCTLASWLVDMDPDAVLEGLKVSRKTFKDMDAEE